MSHHLKLFDVFRPIVQLSEFGERAKLHESNGWRINGSTNEITCFKISVNVWNFSVYTSRHYLIS